MKKPHDHGPAILRFLASGPKRLKQIIGKLRPKNSDSVESALKKLRAAKKVHTGWFPADSRKDAPLVRKWKKGAGPK